MQNARLDEAQVGIKIARRNINNVRYRDDTTLMAEREEELKNFLVKVKEESEKFGLKLNIQKNKIMFSHSVVSDSLPPHGRQHARLPCPLLSPGVFSNSCYNNISLVVSSPLGEIACKLPMGAYLQLCLLPDMNGSWHQVAIVLELQPQSDIRDSKY